MSTTKRKGKTVPCEGCRERKKKCTTGQPCERCNRLGIQCYYIKSVIPPKIEYIEAAYNQQLQFHINMLEENMKILEKELYSLKLPLLVEQQKYILEDTNSDTDSSTSTFTSSLSTYNSSMTTSKDWKLTFNKDGSISINTDIQSHSNLLNYIKTFSTIQVINRQPTLPVIGYLKRNGLSSIIRKGSYLATVQSIQNQSQQQQHYNNISQLSVSQPLFSLSFLNLPETSRVNDKVPSILYERKELSLELINTYFSCCFLNHVIFHQKTFYDMFIKDPSDLETSPVVSALCAIILVIHCKHIMAIVPYDQQFALGEYYFNKARSFISIQFDEPTLETMITYLLMSLYKGKILQPKASYMYLDMAIRIRQILIETVYRQPHVSLENNCRSGEYETFVRLHAAFLDATQFIQFINNQRGIPLNRNTGGGPKAPMTLDNEKKSFLRSFYLACQDFCLSRALPDETQEIKRAIMREYYIGRMSKTMHPYLIRVRFSDDDCIPLSFIKDIERDINRLYYQQIPKENQLNSTIFEDGIHEIEFKRRMKEDKRSNPDSVSLAAQYFQCLIALYEPYLPILPVSPTLTHHLLTIQGLPIEHDMLQNPNNNKRKRNVMMDEQDVSSYDLLAHTLRAQAICYKSAIQVVRLLDYQSTVLGTCTISSANLLCAWDILIRNSCLAMTEKEIEEEIRIKKFLSIQEVRLSREYALRCIEIFRRGYMFNSAEKEIWAYYEAVAKQLSSTLCQPTPSTATYWEPASI
ncbi:uncharacterized protein BX663DRAFT_495522 [Cokeromyces recurvatus]|uniref:uncharacterized protein n=1 Tax=Cokeromyces recurvatus TaxID=90255 RepID=UPI0022203B3F|nr:uncharacterized protein BX663DRAFT_495522 [Cokeromyces recurvatus]KAI7907326.1 hypothetical protein BX663DRAFT_495522 [Cokeromyces recurvatus]